MQRRRRSNRHSAGAAPELPADVLQILIGNLSQEDVANASAVCKAWARELRRGITSVKLVLAKANANHSENGLLHPLATHSPNIQDLQVVLSGRSSYSVVQGVVSKIHMLPKLQKLRLSFFVSPTPKTGPWPLFFSDNINIGQLNSLVLEGSAMPAIALTNLLDELSGSRQLRQLLLLSGQPAAGSQLPQFKIPAWLQAMNLTPAGPPGVALDHLSRLAKLKSLQELALPLDTNMAPANCRQLSKLKGLTALTVLNSVSMPWFTKLGTLKNLRKLAVSVRMSLVMQELDAAQFQHLRELHLGLQGPTLQSSSVQSWLLSLSGSLPCSLKGLSLSAVPLCSTLLSIVTAMTSLTSLQMDMHMPLSDAAGPITAATMDLSSLAELKQLRRFGLSFRAMPEGVQIALAAPPQQQQPLEQDRVLRKRTRRSYQEHLQQQQAPQMPPSPAWGDLSGMFSFWPQLQQLQLSGLPSTAVLGTSWDGLSSLTSLTSLQVQLTLPQVPASPGTGGNDDATPVYSTLLEEAAVQLRLQSLPKQLRELQLTNVMVVVPATLPFGAHLTSLSLAHCFIKQQVASDSRSATGGGNSCVVNNRRSRRSITSQNAADDTPKMHALSLLLYSTHNLQQLELINLPWLDDAVLAAAAASAAAGAAITGCNQGLSSLSVAGIGNQSLTHGGLLGLRPLRKLRQLRWHVGDALELMPDMTALAQLTGLMALHIPTFLHNQMERWGGYAVLSKMRLCDVHVEMV